MFRLQTLSVPFICVLICAETYGGPIAESVGVYLPDETGQCNDSIKSPDGGWKMPDMEFQGVCVPVAAISDQRDRVMQAVLELTNPELLEASRKSGMFAYGSPDEAYRVELEKYETDNFYLKDGSVFKNLSIGYVGYLGPFETGILFRKNMTWTLCVAGSDYSVSEVRHPSFSSTRRVIHGKDIEELKQEPEC